MGWGNFGDAGPDVQFRYADWERAVAAVSDGPDEDDTTIVRGLD
jgi:hypothetical protein